MTITRPPRDAENNSFGSSIVLADPGTPIRNVGVKKNPLEHGIDGSIARIEPSFLDRVRGAIRGFRLGDRELNALQQAAKPRPLATLHCEFEQDNGSSIFKRIESAGDIPILPASFDGHRYAFRFPEVRLS